MTPKTLIHLRFEPIFWLNVFSATLLVLRYLHVIDWDLFWCLLPWIVAVSLWVCTRILVFFVRRAILRVKRNHPAFKGGN
jgi:hypothetical protein